MEKSGRTLFIDFESTYCFVYCLVDDRPMPIRSGYEQNKHICLFSLDPKNSKYEVITQNIEGDLATGAIIVTNVLLLAASKQDDPDFDKIKMLVDVDVKVENGEMVLTAKYKSFIYTVRCIELVKGLVKKLINTAEDFLKEEITSVLFSTSLELNYTLNERVLSILSDAIHDNGIMDVQYIPYTNVILSYFGIRPEKEKRVLLLHYDYTHFSVGVIEYHNNQSSLVTTFSNIVGGYRSIQYGLAQMVLTKYKETTGNEMFSEKVRSSISLWQKKLKELVNEISNLEIEMKDANEYDVCIGKGKNAVSILIQRELYIETKKKLYKELIDSLTSFLQEHKIMIDSISQLLVEGFNSRDSLFQNELVSVFTKNRCVFDPIPEEVIGSGLCLLNQKPIQRFANKNYGLLLSPTQFILFIAKGTPLPCQVRKDFTTAIKDQTEFMTYLVSKETPDSEDYVILDSYYIDGLKEIEAFEFDFEFVLQIDEQGILSVSCYEQLFEKELLSTHTYCT